VARFAVRRLDEIPTVPESSFAWYPLQHHFGLDAFGANVFVATQAGDVLVGEHDEGESGQQELYVVVRGTVDFTLDDERHQADAITVVAVIDPFVRRHAVARAPGATLLAVGAEPAGEFHSTWRRGWFEHVPRT
jgi:hypothetical protein